MGIYVPWLADAAKMTGYPVVEEAGWRRRGHGGFRCVEGIVGHHTAGPRTGEYPSRNVIKNGRTGLPGPLANYGLGRSGTIYVVAAGAAYHAGKSAYSGYANLNDEFLGIEAEDDGDGTWTAAQIDCYPRLVAAALHYMRRPYQRYASHRTIAVPAGRKPDPRGLSDSWFHGQVNAMLKNPASIRRGGGPITPIVPTNVPVRVLGVGDSGDDVKWVQARLTYHGHPTAVDGGFGPQTEASVKAFQTNVGIEADGLVGKVTVSYLGQTTPKEAPVTEAEMDRIADKVFAKIQPKGGASVGEELDMLRRDMREVGKALGLDVGNATTVDGKIES